MRVLSVLISCLVCLSSASFYDVLEQESVDVVGQYWDGMDHAPLLVDAVSDLGDEAKDVEEDVKEQLALSLKEVLANVLGHIHGSFEKAEKAAKDLMTKAVQLVKRLKSLEGVGGELLERLREKVKDWVKAFLEKLPLPGHEYQLIRIPLELDEKNLMENVKQNIVERLNLKAIVEYVKSKLAKLGEVGQVLLEVLQRPDALERLKDLVEVLLPGHNQNYSLKDVWAKVRDFFKGVGIKISEKFFAFSNWVKETAHKGWVEITDKAGKLKELAQTVASKAGTMSKQVAHQALEFFKEHKSEIGEVAWSLVKGALTAVIAQAG